MSPLELDRLPSFALLAGGYAGGLETLWTGLVEAADGPLVYLPFEGDATRARRFRGERHVLTGLPLPDATPRLRVEPPPTADYAANVATIREAIARGDVYQVCLTLRARLHGARSGLEVLGALCRPEVPRFAAWVRLPDGTEFVSGSPELFLQTGGRTVRSEPMKGTAAAGAADALLASAKDAAELAMITDLVRNDLTPVCEPRSVRVVDPRRLVPLAYAVQTVSVVEGTLHEEDGVLEALAALHPGGSVTGAPKQAALELLHSLEPTPRGAYCGTLGLVEADRATFALLIRTATRRDGWWEYGVGSGVVYDSEAGRELDELRVKLGALEGT